MSYYKKIDGKDIYLASINLDDASKYMTWVNQPDNIVFDGYKGKKIDSLENACSELKELSSNTLAIIDKEKEQFIGLVGFTNTQAMNQRSHMWIKMSPDIGYDYQVSKGAQAADLMLKYAFDTMNLHNVVIDVAVFNQQLLDICFYSQMNFMYERKYSSRLGNSLYSTISFQCLKQHYGTKKSPMILSFSEDTVSVTDFFDDESRLSPVLVGKHIQLSRYCGQDGYVSRMAEFLNDSQLSIPLGEYKVNWDDSLAKEHLDSVDYVIEKDGNIIGYINLFRKDFYNKTADLEILIGDYREQNKGYATEAMQLFLEEQYQNGPFCSLVSSVFDFNSVSIKLHEKLRWDLIGTRSEAYYAYGKLNDMYVYEMNRDLYRKSIVKMPKNS